MSSAAGWWNQSVIVLSVTLLGIVAVALVVNRALKAAAGKLVCPAEGGTRAEQARERQTRHLADLAYGLGSGAVWLVALLTVLAQLGISPLPAVAVLAVTGIVAGLGARQLVRDVLAGFHIVLEDQYAAGETVQIGEATGKVEQLTLRRSLLRDARGALVTIANGDVRQVANLSRDWGQAFVDVEVAPELPLEKSLAVLEAAAASLRADGAWAQALLDGPRVTGVQNYGRSGSVLRVQVKTPPLRQDEIARELRRRIQLEFEKNGISPAQGRTTPVPVQEGGREAAHGHSDLR